MNLMTLNDPIATQNTLYYAFATNLAHKIDSALRNITNNDIFVNYLNCKPILPNQDIEIAITNRTGVSITHEIEPLVQSICLYLHERTVKEYHHLENCQNINVLIQLKDIGTYSTLTVDVLKIATANNSLVYTVVPHENIHAEALRDRFRLRYSPKEETWSLEDCTKEYFEEYNEWFKANTIDVATAQLISRAKNILEERS